MFGPSLVFMMMLSAIGGGGSVDLAGRIGPELYWQHVDGAAPSTRILIATAAPPDVDQGAPAPDIGGLIDQLAAPSYPKRKAAAERIVEHGPAIIPQLEAAKDHEDPEVRVHVDRLIGTLSKRGDAWPLRRLMAVRTLGRRKAEAALPMLNKLANSDDPFLRDAALEARAAIEGKTYDPRRVTEAQLEADLALLPPDSRIVAQVRGVSGGSHPTLATLFDPKLIAGLGAQVDVDEIEEQRDRATAGMINFIERVGNLRVDALTVGVTGNPERGGVWVLIVRGLCDPEALGEVLAGHGRGKQERDGHTFYELEDVDLWLASADRLVVVAAERNAPRRAALARLFAAAAPDAEAGDNNPRLNDEVAALIRTVDRGATPAWLVASLDGKVVPANPVTDAFKSAALTAKPTKRGGVKLNLRAEGDDARKVAAAMAVIKAGHQTMMKRMADHAPPMKDLRETVEGLRIEQPDGAGKVEMSIEVEDTGKMMMPMVMPMMWWYLAASSAPAPPAANMPMPPEAEQGAVDQAAPAPGPDRE